MNENREPDPSIRARGVVKKFGDFTALDAFDIDVRRGECVGLLGPNGAGKSTFIGCLYGVVLRSGGELTVLGEDPATRSRTIKRRIGVVPQENALDEELTVLENMRIYARFEGLVPADTLPRIERLLQHMSLEKKRGATIKTLSGGMKRRLVFVRALLSDPELLILDEPTTGLDPSVRHLIWERVVTYREAGKTVLVTTHYMHEAEMLCDRIVILDRGKVVATGSPRELIASHAPGYAAIFPREARSRVETCLRPEWEIIEQGWQFLVRAGSIEELAMLQQKAEAVALQLRPSNLEDVYLKLTGRELGENE